MGRYRGARTGARLQGAACFDAAHLRRRRRRHRADRGQARRQSASAVMRSDLPSLAQICRNAPRLFGRGLMVLYRYTIASLVGFRCRHLPTCSEYADVALDRFGLWAGGWMTLARLCRCHPLGTSGLDFVPDTLDPRSRWFRPWRYGRWRGVNVTPPARRSQETNGSQKTDPKKLIPRS